jgi:hypothetical protein
MQAECNLFPLGIIKNSKYSRKFWDFFEKIKKSLANPLVSYAASDIANDHKIGYDWENGLNLF